MTLEWKKGKEGRRSWLLFLDCLANWANLSVVADERAALLSVSVANISASGLCLTSSWMSCVAVIHHSSQRKTLMTGSMAPPELMAATVAQLSQKMRTVEPMRTGSQRRSATRRFHHSETGNGEFVKHQAQADAAMSLQAGIYVDDVLSSGRLDEGESGELAQETNEPTKIFSLAAGLREMEPACSAARASRSLETKTLVPVIHLVARKILPRKFPHRDGHGGEELDSEDPGFFHLERVTDMVSQMGSKTTPIQVIMVVGP